jgi:1,4-dihydroxy-2-naphthoate octaprenyltransferase
MVEFQARGQDCLYDIRQELSEEHRVVAQAQTWTRGEVWRRKLLYPGHTLPTAAAPVLVACGLAVHDRVFAPAPALLALLAGWLIQVGGVLTDNYENLLDEPEDREHPELVRAVRLGTLSLAQLKAAIVACYGLALGVGAILVYLAGPLVLWIGLASIAASWAYSAGPCPVGKLGFADPLFFVFFGIVSVAGAYYVQAQALPTSALALGVPVGALTTNILIIDDIRDREFDAVKGKRTVAVRFGKEWSRAEFLALLALAYLAPLGLWIGLGFSAWILLPWVTAPFALATARAVLTLDRYEQLLPVTPMAGRLLLAYSALLAIGAGVSSG